MAAAVDAAAGRRFSYLDVVQASAYHLASPPTRYTLHATSRSRLPRLKLDRPSARAIGLTKEVPFENHCRNLFCP
jgi:hypothetical protein